MEAGVGGYLFQYPTHSGTSVAIGPTVHFNDQDVSLELGLLYDLQEYLEYGGSGASTTSKHQLLIPLLGHYRFSHSRSASLFATFGAIFGGKYFLDENKRTQTTSAFSFVLGAGASFEIIRNFSLRLNPLLRYCEGEFTGSVLAEAAYRFGK